MSEPNSVGGEREERETDRPLWSEIDAAMRRLQVSAEAHWQALSDRWHAIFDEAQTRVAQVGRDVHGRGDGRGGAYGEALRAAVTAIDAGREEMVETQGRPVERGVGRSALQKLRQRHEAQERTYGHEQSHGYGY